MNRIPEDNSGECGFINNKLMFCFLVLETSVKVLVRPDSGIIPNFLKLERVARVAAKHRKFAGTVGSTVNMGSLIDMGYRFISIGADVIGLSQYFYGITADFKKIRENG